MPLQPYNGILGTKRAAHLLRRVSFGPALQDIDTFSSLNTSQALQILFDIDLPDPLPPIDPATGTEWVLSGTTDANSDNLDELMHQWFIGMMLSNGIPDEKKLAFSVREKLVFFLHTYFTTITSKVNDTRALYFQNQLFRKFAFDEDPPPDPDPEAEPLPERNFKVLSKKICVDNAMLIFLDGNQNVKGSPNENYAREFLELYSIGRGLEGNIPPGTQPGDYIYFTEQDVQAGAKVLSGFQNDREYQVIDEETELPRGLARGNGTIASSHDNDPKQFSFRLDNAIIQADPDLLLNGQPTEESVIDEIDQFVELIYSKEETAKHLCRKLYRFFVYHEITPEIDNSIIATMAQSFVEHDFKLQPLVMELLSSQHFYEAAPSVDDDKFGGLIKSPFDLISGTLNLFSVELPEYTENVTAFNEQCSSLLRSINDMGMSFYEPFDVAGYDAYHQFPIYNRSWIAPNYLARRYEFIRNTLGMMNPDSNEIRIDVVQFVQNNINNAVASDARQLIITLAGYLFPNADNLTFDRDNDEDASITAERMHYFLIAFLFSPQIDPDPEATWTFRWTNLSDMEVVRGQLENLFNALLQSPEYQLS